MPEPIFSAVILTAAPSGMGADAGGAFVKIDGRESLLRAVELFLNRENVKQVVLVFTDEMLEEGKRKYGGHLSFTGVRGVSRGKKWIDQLAAAAGGKLQDGAPRFRHGAAPAGPPVWGIDAHPH